MKTIVKESYSPEVGPFYVIDGVVFADTESVRDIEGSREFKDSDNSHYKYWRALQKFGIVSRRIDYDYYPRGRVVYKVSEDKYYLYADKCILKDSSIVDSIIDELGLPRNKVVTGEDEHYQCHQCNHDYIEIEEDWDED